MVAVSIENFYELIPRFQDGLPTTTKANNANHGFGVKSMQATCARYNGMLHMGAKDGVFYLNALLADPQAQELKRASFRHFLPEGFFPLGASLHPAPPAPRTDHLVFLLNS